MLTTGKISTNATNYGGIAVCYSDSYTVNCCYTSVGSAFSVVFGTLPSYCYDNLTTEELYNQSTFEGFDFDLIWKMDERLKRPVLNEDVLKIKTEENKVIYQIDSYMYDGSAILYIVQYQDSKMQETRTTFVQLGTTERGSASFATGGSGYKLFLVDEATYEPLCSSVES